jgi:hypothetical protein
LYKIQQWVTYDKADWDNYENNKQLLGSVAAQATTTEVVTAEDDLYPVDTNYVAPEFRTSEIEKIKKDRFWKINFSKVTARP